MIMPWWGWVLLCWIPLSAVVGVVMGLSIREADHRQLADFCGAVPAIQGLGATAVARPRPRKIPVPSVAVTLAGLGVSLEAVGYVLRAAGQDRGSVRLLSMDLPLSVPRMYITGLFVAAAVAAFLGGSRDPGRRAWWCAVGAVAAVVALVKGSGTVHARALDAVGLGGRPVLAAAASAAVAGIVLGFLWWLSRTERRDRRRVLGAFALYAIASVGLSGVSSLAAQASGASAWAAAATFVEESGEALGAVTVLMAVLIGVAPRLGLPADWALRRSADAVTIDSPETLPQWAAHPDQQRG